MYYLILKNKTDSQYKWFVKYKDSDKFNLEFEMDMIRRLYKQYRTKIIGQDIFDLMKINNELIGG